MGEVSSVFPPISGVGFGFVESAVEAHAEAAMPCRVFTGKLVMLAAPCTEGEANEACANAPNEDAREDEPIGGSHGGVISCRWNVNSSRLIWMLSVDVGLMKAENGRVMKIGA